MCIKATDYCSLSSKAMFTLCQIAFRARGGGGTPSEKPHRYVLPQGVGCFGRVFGLTTDIHFGHFGLESGMFFERNTEVYERIYRCNSK